MSQAGDRLPEPTGDDSYFSGSREDKALGMYQLLAPDGTVRNEEAAARIDRELALRMYRGMLTIRVVDARMMALQRQGRIGFYGEALGQEAAVIGSAAAVKPDDWLVPALREAGAGLYRGLTLDSYIAQIFGNDADVSKGRQMPCHPCDRDNFYVVMSSCVANQLPQAAGIAMGMKIRGDAGRICIGYCGDGGTSEPDFHVAMNFAGVSKAPLVLVCQNNQWAISTPGTLQTASRTIAIKGLAYGIESVRADGNDALAAYTAVKYAADKARSGAGPMFVELLTYRVGAHTSSDDPSRYRDESITEVWKNERDPLVRMRGYLVAQGWLAEGESDEMASAIETEVRAVIARQEPRAAPALETLIEDVFEEPPWHLREQLDDYVRAGIRPTPGHGHGK